MIGAIGATGIVRIVDTYLGCSSHLGGEARTEQDDVSSIAAARNHEPPTSRSVQRLEALVGRWRTEGHIVGEPPIPVRGTDIYEWLPGGFFLVHHVDVLIQDQPVQAIEIIGELDQATGSIIGRAYDNRGEMTILYATVDAQGVWTFTGGADIAPVAQPSSADARGAVRSTLTVSPDRSGMTAMWERSDNGTDWEPWMHIRFTRMP